MDVKVEVRIFGGILCYAKDLHGLAFSNTCVLLVYLRVFYPHVIYITLEFKSLTLVESLDLRVIVS